MSNPWLYVTDSKFRGIGIDQVTEQQVIAFSERSIPVSLVARGRLALPGIKNCWWPLPPTKFLSWLPSQDYYALNKRFFSHLGRRYIKRNDYTGVVAWSKTALHIFEAAEKRGMPRLLNVGTYHRDFDSGGTDASTLRWPRISLSRYRAEYELASMILVASDFAAETFINQGVPRNKVRVIYRGADTTRFFPLPDKPARPFIVASCGRLGERKGTYELLRAWQRLALPDAELWLIGQVPESEAAELHALAGPSVRFLGFRKDLPEVLRQVHLHVLLSRNEGLAKVLLEAGASGVPNLCTREAGLPADAEGTIFVQDRNCEDEVMTAIEACYRDPSATRLLGLAARQMIETQYGWAAFRARFAQACADVAGP
ncbi:MAG TPA: glycosyltransferase family 4 protein [Azonexus sp.]|nr:glycosyltransferase family 4 protein [Azonexus sp.]